MYFIKPAPENARVLRVKEAAQRYRVSKSHLYNLMRAGKLRSVALGKARLIPVDAMEALLRDGVSE